MATRNADIIDFHFDIFQALKSKAPCRAFTAFVESIADQAERGQVSNTLLRAPPALQHHHLSNMAMTDEVSTWFTL